MVQEQDMEGVVDREAHRSLQGVRADLGGQDHKGDDRHTMNDVINVMVLAGCFVFVQYVSWQTLMFYCLNRRMANWFRWTVLLPFVPLVIVVVFSVGFWLRELDDFIRKGK